MANAFLARQQARHEWELKRAREHAIQFSEDIMLIAANEVFGAGADRLLDLHEAFCHTFGEYMDLAVADLEHDKEMDYSIEVLERKLKQVCGKNYISRDNRYSTNRKRGATHES